jgi:hypothetical protein
MSATRLLAVALLALLSIFTVAAGTHAPVTPVAAGCAPGGGYDPACDVNHDDQIDVTDILLTAGHWGETGAWTIEPHTHLGQIWTGSDNPLKIQGSFAAPDYAPLVLGNSYPLGHGIVVSAELNGVEVDSAGEDGVYVHTAGNVSQTTQSGEANGFEVAGAQANGLFVGKVGANGVEVTNAVGSGLLVERAGSHGIQVSRAEGPGADGLRIGYADDDAIQLGSGSDFPSYGLFVPEPGTSSTAMILNTAQSSGEWALLTPDKIKAGNVLAGGYSVLAVVSGDQALSPGDLASAQGVADPLPGSSGSLPQVTRASADRAGVVGVVQSRMALQPAPGKPGVEILHSVDGPAARGDYVALTVLGVALVKVDSSAEIQPGQRLTASDVAGKARALRSVKVEGIRLAEDAATVGVALEAAGPGTEMVPVFVMLR